MLLNRTFRKFVSPISTSYYLMALPKCFTSGNIENEYSDVEKKTILKVINEIDLVDLSRYDVTKTRLKKFSIWRNSIRKIENLSDIELVEGFTKRTAIKFFDSILRGPQEKTKIQIRGQILHPQLTDVVREESNSVLAVYIAVNSICWTLINRSNYEVIEWNYYGIDQPDGKKLRITDTLDIAWHVTQQLPAADVYVMKAETTTLRAGGNDPNNPKVLTVNLQKSQMVAMIVALINAKCCNDSDSSEEEGKNDTFQQKVYFLRSNLPFRLYGTLVGNEQVSTAQTVEMLLQNANVKSSDRSHVYVPEKLQKIYKRQNDLQKDMLGHCLLLALTFMDLCIYRNQEKISKIAKRGE